MTKLLRSLVNLPMTIAISGLVLGSIVVSIAVVSGAIYFNLHAREVAETSVLERNNISVAASVLERRISGSSLKWTDDGDLVSFETFAIPIFYDSRVIDSVTRVVKQDAAILAFDAASQTLISKTASFTLPDGTTELTFTGDSAIYGPVSRGEPFVGEAEIQGQRYFGAAQPILKAGGEVIGAIFVAVPAAELQAAANGTLQLILVAGLLITLTLGTIGVLMSRAISKPIPNLARSMRLIADGNFATAVPYVSQTNEIGGMAKAVEVFRNNGLKVRELTAAEERRVRADALDRQTMMSDLQVAFGGVVDAAIGGDFSRRVDVSFPDSELNSLATSINSLVSNFNRGVMETGQVLGAIAEADLRQRIRGDYAGAFAQLKTSTNAVAEKLTQIVARLRVTSSGLKIAAGEISSGSVELSERTTRQAAAIEETSAAMEQVASTVLQNARLASDASSSAATMTQTAVAGGRVMQSVTDAMGRITESSAKISNVIGLIDDIAFQTNLLALNASVEAARAGDAGQGFAVVAVEVRRLAQSAAKASKEVKQFIDQSSSEVATGSKFVDEASAKFKVVLDAAHGNEGLLTVIAKQSHEQASAIDEIKSAVRQLDEMTQHNAALVDLTNVNIERTEAQANELDRIVEIFQITDNTASLGHGVEKPVPQNVLRRGA